MTIYLTDGPEDFFFLQCFFFLNFIYLFLAAFIYLFISLLCAGFL